MWNHYSLRVPRKHPLPKREKEICARLLEFRTSTGLSRVAFAKRAGVNTGLLRSYETANSQLNYPAAYKIITSLGIGPEWLATGLGSKVDRVPIPTPAEINASPRSLFSHIFDNALSSRILKGDSPNLTTPNEFHARWRVWYALRAVTYEWMNHVPASQLQAFWDAVNQAADKAIASYGHQSKDEIWRRGLALEKEESSVFPFINKAESPGLPSVNGGIKDYLDSFRAGDNVLAMKAKEVPTWPQLKKTIAKLTAGHGQKAALADELGVSQQVLGNWLSDGKQGAPNAELTLRLFKWSLDPKRQQTK